MGKSAGYMGPWGNRTGNYHINVQHAFKTAPTFANFTNWTVSGDGSDTVVAAHSLGNMLVSSAMNDWKANISKYFLVNAAVALEAYGDTEKDPNMVHLDWSNYNERLWASEWHTKFTTPDGRSKLTWRNRFTDLPKDRLYNYYSSGDQVFRIHPNQENLFGAPDLPGLEDINSGKVLNILYVGTYSWSLQEKLKGRMAVEGYTGSTYGGWGFNLNDYSEPASFGKPISSLLANNIPENELKTKPFFNIKQSDSSLINELTGSDYATINRDRLLAEAIPARTGAAGRNPIKMLGDIRHNFDMQMDFIKRVGDGIVWPRRDIEYNDVWLHSDIIDISYLYIYSLFDAFVTNGGFK